MKTTLTAPSAVTLAMLVALSLVLGSTGNAFADSRVDHSSGPSIAQTWAWNAQYTTNSDCYAYSGQQNSSCIDFWSYNNFGSNADANGNWNNGWDSGNDNSSSLTSALMASSLWNDNSDYGAGGMGSALLLSSL